MNKCETCGGLHYRLDPCRAPKESTAARKDVRRNWKPTEPVAHGDRAEQSQLAGTQALPVDTNTDQKQDASDSLGSGPTIASAKAPVTKQLSKASLGNTDGSDPLKQTRPAKFDKTAYQRSYMRDWRKRQKEKRGGQRTEQDQE